MDHSSEMNGDGRSKNDGKHASMNETNGFNQKDWLLVQ